MRDFQSGLIPDASPFSQNRLSAVLLQFRIIAGGL
jgi:hypothetical protein